MTTRVLLVDDDRAVREALAQTLMLADCDVLTAGSFIEAKDHITRDFDGVVLSDIRMPGKDGFALLAHVHAVDTDLPVILLTGEGDIPMAVRGMSGGAFAFLEKPCDPDDLIETLRKAQRTRAVVLENRALKSALERGDAASRMLFGRSELAEALRARVRSVARSGADVLISGAPGSGNAKVAEVIHLLAAGSVAPFEKTPADGLSPGGLMRLLESAQGGTLYLDEVTQLPAGTQFALLDRLEEEAGAKNIRVVAGTYREIDAEMREGRFNSDLFYRLDVMRVRIPTLKERPEDIPILFRHYLRIACEQANLPEPEVPAETLSRLMAQDWPGNARSLMNAAMRYALGLSESPEVADMGLAQQMAAVERSILIAALQECAGNATEAAQSLKLPRKTFYDKLARHEIRAEDFRV